MAIRWGAPVLAAGIVALAANVPAIGGYFGATNYTVGTPPNCCAQTHFIVAQDNPGLQTVGYTAESDLNPLEKATVTEEHMPFSEKPAMKPLPPHEPCLKSITETIYTPITETVVKEVRTIVKEKVHETLYKEYTVNVSKKVCEPVPQIQCYMISKPVCDTVVRETPHKVRKTVTETHFKECQKSVCTPVTETVMKEVSRTAYKEVQETICREVCKTVEEKITFNRVVTKLVPETVCEEVCVRGRLAWKEVPRYECSFDPCTCTIVHNQVGTTHRLIREPAHTVTRQVTRDKTIVEQVPETKVVKKTVVEKVPTTVTRKVPTTICEKVPVTVTKNVTSMERVKVPYTVTKHVLTVEVVKVPETIHRQVLGAYVDAASLSADAAKAATGVEFVPGGPAALANPKAAIYECNGSGRIFVEGLRGTRTITQLVTKTIQTTEVRKVPCQVTRIVEREVVRKVPTTVTRLVPKTVTRLVACTTCKDSAKDLTKPCQEVVTNCPPVVILKEPCQPGLKIVKLFSDMVPANVGHPTTSACAKTCTPPCPCAHVSAGGNCPATRCGLTACTTSGSPCGCSTCKGWLSGIFSQSNHTHPVRDFLGRLWCHHVSCDSDPAGTAAPNPVVVPSTMPQKMPTKSLPPVE